MVSIRFTFILAIFVLGFSSSFSQPLPNSTSSNQIAYLYVTVVDDTTLFCVNPDLSEIGDCYFDNNTVLRLLDGSIHITERSKIESHKFYKISSKNGFADFLEQVFLYPCGFVYKELTFGILNTSDANTENSTKKFNGLEFLVPMYYYSTILGNSYKEYPSEWFENNIGTYILFGYQDNNSLIEYKKLSNFQIQNSTGTVSNINGKEFTIFGNPVYVSPSTKFYDESGNTLLLEVISENDRLDIDYFLYINKYIALRITKLPHIEEVNRYSEDVIKVTNDTIYTTSHFLKLSSIQSKKDVNGEDITTDSLFAHYRAVTFEVPSNENRNEIRNVDFLHSTFNQKDSLHYRGTAIGRINSIQFPNLTVGANQYVVANDAKIRNKFGDSALASETTIPNNALVKVFYARVENVSSIDYVVNFISMEDTSTFSSVNEPKERSFSVFPNPITTNQTTIEFFSEVDEMIQLNVVSVDGKTIYSQNLNVNNCNNTITTNLKSIPNGQYYLEIVSSNNKKRHSIPIQILR